MDIKEMLKLALRRGPSCACADCDETPLYKIRSEPGFLCESHKSEVPAGHRYELKDVDGIREILAFLQAK